MSYSYLLDTNGKIQSHFLPSGSNGNTSNIQQVLSEGDDANGQQLTNLSYLKSNGYIEIGNAVGSSSQLHLNYSDGTAYGSNYQIVAGADAFSIQQYKKQSNNTLLMKQPLLISSAGAVTTSFNGQLFVTDGTNVGHVFDSYFNPVSASGTLQGILTLNPSAGNEDIEDVNNLTVNTSITLNTKPLYVNQAYYQGVVDTTSLNMVSGLSNSDMYFKVYPIVLTLYPQCCHYIVTVSQLNFTVVTSTPSGSINAQMYLIDNLTMNNISSTDLAKSVQSVTVNIPWSAGENTIYNTPFTLEYCANSPPSTLGIVMMTNSVSGAYLSRSLINFAVNSETQIINRLPALVIS